MGGNGTLFLAAYDERSLPGPVESERQPRPHQRQRLLMLMKVMEVYELEGPRRISPFTSKAAVAHESHQLIYGWMDTHLKPPEATKNAAGHGRGEVLGHKGMTPSYS